MNKKTYHIIIIGCQMNKSDGERVANYLESHTYIEEKDPYKADLVVILSCGVRYSAESRIYGLIPHIKKQNPKVKIVLSGCLVVREDIKKSMAGVIDYYLPIVDLPNFIDILDGKKMQGAPRVKKINPSEYLKEDAKYKSNYSAFVPIGNGCNNFCSYCFVPYARGREVYRSVQEIIDEVKNLIKKNYKEITLIAQNVNSYEYNANTRELYANIANSNNANKEKNKIINFPILLKMVNDLEGDFWLRFSTSHPKDMSDELIEVMSNCDKLCHHVHIAVQSGDDQILERMNRKYTGKHFVDLIKKIRKSLDQKIDNTRCPEGKKDEIWQAPTSITTDIIVGFPGETEKQFLNTVKLFKELNFDMAYISRFSSRPMTAAEKMEDNVSPGDKKEREERLMEILCKTALQNNKQYLGEQIEVLVDGKKEKTGECFGHTRTGKGVRFRSEDNLRPGNIVKVKITEAEDFRLRGELVKIIL